ncbi:hypothetical protein [Psychrobacter sp. SMN/5/1215-MNA-CIBAN-0208]|uniref:hypothetical protein n=1 Tax=Psychrobacter sp. SMN/5/1215-MNA-CIBAN-0208 TaxID=3140442 RepID=UPI003329A622
MKEQIFSAKNGVDVKFKHKPSKYDFNHIVFVFSGFLKSIPGNYDFIRALEDCPCDVIWINDDFEGMYSYYLCVNMNFRVENAITEFIKHQVQKKSLPWDNVTVTGFSKGGTAALYYGLKLDIKNIVTTVPQIYIGSYLDKHWKPTAKHMMGENYSKIKIQYLDNLLPHLIYKDTNIKKNIYLLTSESDEQYELHIKPFISLFGKYSNFNLLKTYSLFVRQHNQVTGHHTSLLLSIYYALASEAVPRFNDGLVSFFGSQPALTSESSLEPLIDLQKINIVGNRLFIEGIALLKGLDAENYSDIDYKLIFKGTKNYSKPLAKDDKPKLTRDFFENTIISYDKCWFTTYKHEGIDISDIDRGSYVLHIKIKIKNHEENIELVSLKNIVISNNIFTFSSSSTKNILTFS